MKIKAKIIALIMLVTAICAISLVGCGLQTHVNRKLTFEVDGTAYKIVVTDGKSAVEFPQDPSKTGYAFGGWYYDKDEWTKEFKTDSLVEEPLTANLIVYAKWNELTYEVKFVSEGETIKTETVEYGASATAPADLTKTGYTFAGWDKEFTNIEDNLTVTAIWTANKYAVTLNANDATACEALTEYTYGQGATLPVPQKTGYTFNGWFVAEDFTGEAVTEIGATDSGDKAFFAKWTINVYTVKFINANGDELKSEQIEYGNMPAYDGEPALESDAKWVYTFKGWHKEVEVATKNTAYVATYTKAENLGNVYECTYNDEYAGYVFENTTFVGDAEWKVTMTAENFLKDGGVKLVSDTGSYIAITNDQRQAIYMLASGIEGVEGYMNGKGRQKGGENVTFTMTFKFVKVGAKIYGYADNIHIATYASDKIADMFGEHELHLETYRGTAVTGKLSFKTTATKHVYAVNGSTACTDKFEGLTTTDNFTFTASVQGTGLYTYAGIRIWCGEDYVNFYSHTYPDPETVINFDGWNRPTVKTSIALQNSDKATYKVVKTSNNMSFYLNDTLIFEMGPNYSLNANWGEKFFKEGAVYTFGQYVEAGPGGSGYYCDLGLEY